MGIPETPAMPGEAQVRAVLRNVMDPEVGMNIVDLGLIYDVAIAPASIRVAMTMTTPACPMSAMIMEQVQSEIGTIAPAAQIDVQLVWEPVWNSSMMSEDAKKHFGW